MLRVLFLIRSLGRGGAERQFSVLLRGLDKGRFDASAACFYPGGAFWEEVKDLPGLKLLSLDKRGRWEVFGLLRRGLRLVRTTRPQVLYSFGEAANLVALLLGRAAGAKAVWGIRRSTTELPVEDKLALASFWAGAALSRLAHRVVYNSECGRQRYRHRGYSAHNAEVIPNGFDCERFRPDEAAGRRQREAWRIGPSDRLLGIVGRLHPVKGHLLFLRAADAISKQIGNAKFVVIGGGPGGYRQSLQASAWALGLNDRMHWVSECDDVASAYNALDVLVSCSKEEGCPNVLGEAMACGVPCVATDVGDAAALIGDAGTVALTNDDAGIARACSALLQLEALDRKRLGLEARQRILQHFSVQSMVQRTSVLLERLVAE